MNRMSLLVVLLGTVGCSSQTTTAIFELSNSQPVSIECAYNTISSMREFDFVQNKKYAIEFANKSVKGELYHGSYEERFINYGIQLTTSYILGSELEPVASSIATKMSENCANKNT